MSGLRTKRGAYLISGALVAILGLAMIAVAVWYLVINLTADSDVARHTNTEAQLAANFSAAPVNVAETPLNSLVGAYPGRFVNPKFWDTPQSLANEPFGIAGLGAEFTLIEAGDDEWHAGMVFGDAESIRIPAINVDSSVYDLQISTNANGERAYETPDGTVGFIPETGDPGTAQSGWYFGHLESLGEGNIFRRLPRIPELARNDPVDVFVSTATHEFVYRVNATYDVPRLSSEGSDELALEGVGGLFDMSLSESDSAIYLCTCWPPRNYTRRVVIKAELVAFRDLATT